MKKNLILMTALFAGSMIANDGFGFYSKKTKSTIQSAMMSTVIQNSVQVVESNNDMQRDEEQGVDNRTELDENKDDVKHEELKGEQTVIQSDSEGSDVEKMPDTTCLPLSHIIELDENSDKIDAASAISPVELVKVLSQDVITKEEEKKDSVSVESSEDLNGKDSNKIDGTDTISVEPDAVLSQDVAKEEEQKDKMDAAQNGDSANQPSLKRSESEELSSSDKKKLRKSAPRTPRKSKRARI